MKTIRARLTAIGILAVVSLFLLIPRNVTERSPDPATGRMRDTTVRRVPIALGLDLSGGIHLGLEIDQSKGIVADCADAIRRAERVVRTRINEFGTSEPLVQVVGDCRLIVELPGITDVARAKAIVQRSAFLEFRLTDSRNQFQSAILSHRVLSDRLLPGAIPGEFIVGEDRVALVDSLLASPEVQRLVPRGLELKWGTQAAGESHRPLYAVESRAIITGEDLEDAAAARDPRTNASEVQFQLSRVGGERFARVTGRNVGNHLAILLDGRVQGQPAVIEERIGSRGRISMAGKSLQEASDLALTLRAGALPAPLHIVEEGTIGPSLGADSIRAGVRASLLAFAFVLVIMGVFYGVSGLLAIAALLLYILYGLGALAAFGFALTLPGLAGFALSIAMAVDANVLIFERIREELERGKSVPLAVREGFRHAMSAIVDSNVTTALTALILYAVGTEAVRGFAITLLIGIAASMISAIFVTRTFFLIWLSRRPKMTTLPGFSMRLFANAKYDFIRIRRWAYGLTALIVVPGLLLLAARGPTYGIEFTGGALVQVRTAAPAETERLRGALERSGLPGASIQSFGSDRDFVVRARLHSQQGSAGNAEAVGDAIRTALTTDLGADGYSVVRAEGASPTVGAELQQKALVAVLLSFATTLVYLAVRFEWRFGIAAVLATAHDILATVAFITWLDLEVSLVVVAAILTVLGYSLNDTIVIFDRVRENIRARPRMGFAEILNLSINETLPRTVLTGGTTLATALVLSFFAGEVIRPFALVMSFGIVVGTFSSIFVAAPLLFGIERLAARRRTAAIISAS